MKIEIKHRYEYKILFTGEFSSLKIAVEAAISSCADLSDANLSGADLSRANLSGAVLSGAVLSGAKGVEKQPPQTIILPAGDIIGWKKCTGNVMVKLLIPVEAKRSNAGGRKCRAEFARVLEVIGAKVGESERGGKYVAGEKVLPDSWDDNWTAECSHGIHFFITREEAEAY